MSVNTGTIGRLAVMLPILIENYFWLMVPAETVEEVQKNKSVFIMVANGFSHDTATVSDRTTAYEPVR